MRMLTKRLAVAALCVLGSAHMAAAQTADDVISKSVAAIGGRAALEKLKSQSAAGTITLQTPGGEIQGTIETFRMAPNKSRTLIKADLTALGAGPLVLDRRFDGAAGYELNTLEGNHDLAGEMVDNLRNGVFPHPFLNYKALGTSVKLGAKEKVGDRDAYVITFEPVSGSSTRQYIDAETYMPLQVKITAQVPQLGQQVEQTTEFLDYREVDGVKVPFRFKSTSAVQNFTITVTKIEHNVPIDEKLFSKPTP